MNKNKKKNKKKNQNLKNNALRDLKGAPSSAARILFNSEQAIYQKNMQALQRRYPELAEQVCSAQVTNYRVVPAASGKLPNLYVPALNAFYYDQADPFQDVQHQLAALKLKNTRLAVFLGLGLGYESLYFVQKMAKDQNTSYFLIIEKDL